MDFLRHSSLFFYNAPDLTKRQRVFKVGEASVASAAYVHSSVEERQVDRSSPPPEERRTEDMEEERVASRVRQAASPVRQPAPPVEREEAMEEERAEAA